jgi:DnaJ-class molecular chaperone
MEEEDASHVDDWNWCAHADAVRCWEQQKDSWSQDRLRAFQVAQQRLDSFRSSQNQQQNNYAQASYRQVTKASDPLGFYAALGLQQSASLGEIKSAFREAVFESHPDVVSGTNSSAKTDERMKMLLNAYQVLKDDSKRHLYDTQGVC